MVNGYRFKEIRFFGKIGFLTKPKYLSDRGFCFSEKNRNLDHTINVLDAIGKRYKQKNEKADDCSGQQDIEHCEKSDFSKKSDFFDDATMR